ncbi:MAG TPA: c-type cytochrome [Haliangiales bacterium]|nr:c-type cytochrome [Haliangiales bacterium]
MLLRLAIAISTLIACGDGAPEAARADAAGGKEIFATACAPCHAANAGGHVGPNLTDEYWLHGGRPADILASVRFGWVDKGMPAWGPVLGEANVRAVVAYVVSLKNTRVAGGKAPQGTTE